MSTSSTSSVDFSRAVRIQKDEICAQRGLVDATLIRNISDPKHLTEWYRLAAGQEIKVPAGSALAFKVNGDWKSAQFLEDGRIVGPVVCAVDEIKRPKELYHLRFYNQMSPVDALVMLSLTIIFAVTLFPRPDHLDPIYYLASFATMITSFAFLLFMRIFLNYRVPYWRGNDACLEKLLEAKKGPVEI